MKTSRFTEQQITFALKQAETGIPVKEVIRKMGISEQTFLQVEKAVWRIDAERLKKAKTT